MRSKFFVTYETDVKVTGYETNNPTKSEKPALVRHFHIFAAADKKYMDIALDLTSKLLCHTVQNLVNSCKDDTFENYYKN